MTRLEISLGAPFRIASAEERVAAGLHHWIDGTIGFCRHAGAELAFAPNGRLLARHDLRSGSLIDGLVDPEESILGLPADVDHASGGPAWHDPATGITLLAYHGERFHRGDPLDYTSFIGLAASTGGPFRDLGPVVSSERAASGPRTGHSIDLGPGGFVVRDGWMLLYSCDRTAHVVHRNLAVARCRVDEVLDAAATGSAPRFTVLGAGGWVEDALGGSSRDLLPDAPWRVMWFDVADFEPNDEVLCAYSTLVEEQPGRWRWNIAIALSADGVEWGPPALITPFGTTDETLYVSIDGRGSPRTIPTREFDLYLVRAAAAHRWDDAAIDRRSVSLRTT